MQLPARSFDLTCHDLYCSHFTACTHHSTLQHLPFGVCLRHFSVLRWKDSRTYRSPTGLHGGITLVTRVFGSQLYIVSNSYKLVRVPRRLSSPGPSHRIRKGQRLRAPCPARSRHSALSAHKFWRSPQAMFAHRWGHCALCLPHTHAATADASTQLSISEFLLLCFTKHTFRRTVPLRIHEDLREAQTPSNTGDTVPATFADAATQLSFAEFLESCNLSSTLPPCPQANPTQLLDAATQTQCRFR